jgi:hypothetical protein
VHLPSIPLLPSTMSAVKGKARAVEIADEESESEPETDLDDYESSSDSPSSDHRSEYMFPREEPGVGTSTSHNRNPTGNNQWGGRAREQYNISCLAALSPEVMYSPAPLTDKLKNILRELNKNNIVGYSAILQHLSDMGYKLGCVVCIKSYLPYIYV